jgi:hypothetical protein
VFVAIAITDIQNQRIREPALITLAAGGLVVYGIIGWITSLALHPFKPRFGFALLFVLYSVGMGLLFFIATVVCLFIAHKYRGN